MTKLFLESELQHEGNKHTEKNANSQQNLAVSRQQQIRDIKLFKYYSEKDKTKFEQNCHGKERNLPLKVKIFVWLNETKALFHKRRPSARHRVWYNQPI